MHVSVQHDDVRLDNSWVTPAAALCGDDIAPSSSPSLETMHAAPLGRAAEAYDMEGLKLRDSSCDGRGLYPRQEIRGRGSTA